MAKYDNIRDIGARRVQLTDSGPDSSMGKLRRYDRSFDGGTGFPEALKQPASVFPLQLPVASIGSGATEKSVSFKAPFPMKIIAIDLGAETSAGSALTADIHVDGASVLEAPEDVHATVGTAVRTTTEDAKEEVEYDSTIEAVFISTGGTATGGFATVWCQRL